MATEDTTSTDTETSGSASGGASNEEAEKQYTGKDVERIVKSRLDRERSRLKKQVADEARTAAISDLLDRYGLDDEAAIEQLVGAQGEGDKAKRAQAKYERELSKAQKALQEREQVIQNMQGVLHKTLVNDAIIAACSGRCNDPDVAVALLAPRIKIDDDYKPVAVDSDGNPTDMTPQQLVEELVQSKPILAPPSGAMGAGSRAPGAQAGGAPTPMTQAERLQRLAKAFGEGG